MLHRGLSMCDEPRRPARRRSICSSSCFSEMPDDGIRIKLCVSPQSLGNAFALVVKNGRKRSKQVSCQDGSLALGQIEREFLDFSNCGHASEYSWLSSCEQARQVLPACGISNQQNPYHIQSRAFGLIGMLILFSAANSTALE
jgi:hypothetical protein